jgi:glycerate dehydrogenase
MKEIIVITDGYTLEPDESGWSELAALGEVRYYPRTSATELAERCADATIVVTNKTPISAETIAASPALKVIAVTATGYNIIDLAAAARAKVLVCNVPGYGTDSVAQHTVALLLELTNHVGLNSTSVAAGEWEASPDFGYSKKRMVELKDKVLGIVGYGRIGQKVGEIAEALGMKVMYYSPSLKKRNPSTPSLEEIFSDSDVVSLHCPLTGDNREFVNATLIATMKPTALLINTARGQLINEPDLAAALRTGKIGGAALDVLSVEPPPLNHPLLRIPSCIVTPHNAWLSNEARRRIMRITVENIKGALAGTPVNVVSA